MKRPPESIATFADREGERPPKFDPTPPQRIGVMVNQNGEVKLVIGTYSFTGNSLALYPREAKRIASTINSISAVPVVLSVSETITAKEDAQDSDKRR